AFFITFSLTSSFREYFKMDELQEDLSLDPFGEANNSNENEIEQINKDYKKLLENMVVKNKGKVKKDINGKSLKCTEYKATILSEDIITLYKDFTELGINEYY
ncbi:hypothetical protein, partial [Anaerosporobacter sp.]